MNPTPSTAASGSSSTEAGAAKNGAAKHIVWAAAIDVLLVTVFTAIGRGSHAREATVSGFVGTAWPFLVALAVSWLLSQAWKHPLSVVRAGLPIWAGTVIIGLCFRVWFTDSSAALPFILVTVSTLALCLLGWRFIVFLSSNRRGTRSSPTVPAKMKK